MALTRTRFISADTSKAKLMDPITLLNSDSTVANVDVGFLINRNLGASSNVAMIWSESGNSFVVAFTNDTGITNSNLNVSTYANVTAGTIIVNSLKTDNFLYSNGNPFSAPAADYAQTFVADNLSSGNAVFATARITGNLQVEGNIFTIGQQNLSISDAIIDLHTQANLAPWVFNDGKDIGLKFHYYDYQDEHAFLGWANNNGYLEWYDSGREVGNVFTGNTYGTIKSGELVLANATTSSNTVTGALRVSGGVGIAGRLNVGGNIVANSGTASSSTTTGALIVRGGAGISGDTYIGGSLTAAGLQNTPIGTTTPNSGYFNDLNNTLTLKSGGNVVAYSGTASTDTVSGALVVVGGAGISGAVHVGSTIKAAGNIVAASGVGSESVTTGAMVVVGGAGVSGNIYSGSLYTSGLYWAGNNISIGGPSTGLDGSLQYNNGGTLGGTNIIYDDVTGNIVFTDTTTSTSTTTGAVVLAGGLGIAGNVFASGLNGTIYGTLYIGTTDINYNRASASQVLTGVGIDGTAGTATNAINTQITSNILSGTAYVSFVNVTSGNTAQNVNTSLTYNPNTGNLRAYGVLTDTGVYWAGNGAAFSSAPGGSSGQLQYNNNNQFAGANIVFNNNNGNLVITSTVNSTSTSTGALVVSGGAGINGALYILNTGDVSANLGAYQTYANANIGTLFNGNVSTNANLGAFQTYANTKIGTNTNSNLVVIATTTSTSTTTGALVVGGGAGISGNLNVGSGTTGYKATFASPGAGTSGVMFIGASLNGSGNGLVISSTTRTTGDNTVPILHIIARDGSVALSTTVQGNTVIGSTTTSTSTTTGALVVNGGAGVSGALYTGGIIDAAGNIVAASGTASTSTTTGALVVAGGAGISGAIYAGSIQATPIGSTSASTGAFSTLTSSSTIIASGNIVAASGTASTSTTTGALVVVGGVGISGNLNLNETSSTANVLTLNNGGISGINALWFNDPGVNEGVSWAGGNGWFIYESPDALTNAAGNLQIVRNGVRTVTIDTNGTLTVTNTRTSTSTTTGALVVSGGAGFEGNIFTSGWIIPSSNVSQNLGTTTSWWNTFYGVSTQARYADLAENYQADNNYEPGTVLVFGGNMEVTISTVSHDTAVAGVVSTNPAHLMNGALQGSDVVALALQGRVPCQVKGPVSKGTVLVTSDIPGVAEALDYSLFKPGCVLGKSLESIMDNSIKTIEVVVGRF